LSIVDCPIEKEKAADDQHRPLIPKSEIRDLF